MRQKLVLPLLPEIDSNMDSTTFRRSLRHGIPQVDGSVRIAEPTPSGGSHIRWYYPDSQHAAPRTAIRPAKMRVESGAKFDREVKFEVKSYSETEGDLEEKEINPYQFLPKVKESRPNSSSPRSESSPPTQRRPKTLREVHQRPLKVSGSLEIATTVTTGSDCSSILTTSESEVSFIAKDGFNTTLESDPWASFTTQPDDGNYVPICPAGVTFEVPKEWLERRRIFGERQPTEPIL